VALEPDGRIVLAGQSTSSSGVGEFALARFLAAGPQVGSFTASPSPVTVGTSVTLTASGISDANPGVSMAQVAFDLDSNGNGVLDAGDALLGHGSQSSAGTWTFTLSTTGWAPGSYTLFAQAEDSYGAFSDAFALGLTLQ
jgi:hypothetical protein